MIQVFHKSDVRDTKITWAMSQPASLSSRGYQFAGVDFDDPNFQTRAYERRIAQGQSKTANALFAVNLDAMRRRLLRELRHCHRCSRRLDRAAWRQARGDQS